MVSRDTIMQGEGFKGYNHTGRRLLGIQSYREKVSRDIIIQREGFKGYTHTRKGFKGNNHTGRRVHL